MYSEDFRDRPIDCSPNNVTTLGYHRVPFDRDDPRWKEKLVNIADFGIGGESFYARGDSFNEPYRRRLSSSHIILCRESVAAKLQSVNRALDPYGIEIFVWDAFRSIDTQKALWNHFMTVAMNIVGDDRTACARFAEQFCSNPKHFSSSNWTTWPVHCTGGSIDLTLRRRATGELLYMGGIFDDPSPSSATGYLEEKALEAKRSGTLLSASDSAALRNRRLLFHAMCAQGFTNYGFEWWHFYFGTQLWALMQGHRSEKRKRNIFNAFYGFVDFESIEPEYQIKENKLRNDLRATMATNETQFITSKGATFVVEYRGLAEENTSMRFVWLHGWGQSRNAFFPLSSAFERNAFCCLIDLPGFGEAPMPPLDWGTPQYALMLGEWLAQTTRKNARKTVIVAHSFGARVAIHLASQYAQVVDALVLIAGAGIRRRRPLGTRLKASLIKALIRTARGIDLVTNAELSEKLRSKFGSSDYRNAGPMRPILVRVVNEDLSAVASTVSQPTLLVYGERDEETPVEFGQRYASLIRNSRLVVLPHFDHNTILTSGRHQIFLTVNQFLTTLDPG